MAQIGRRVKSPILNHNPKPRGAIERREVYPTGDSVVVGGGTAGEFIQEGHGVHGGRMRDGNIEQASEEAAIA